MCIYIDIMCIYVYLCVHYIYTLYFACALVYSFTYQRILGDICSMFGVFTGTFGTPEKASGSDDQASASAKPRPVGSWLRCSRHDPPAERKANLTFVNSYVMDYVGISVNKLANCFTLLQRERLINISMEDKLS